MHLRVDWDARNQAWAPVSTLTEAVLLAGGVLLALRLLSRSLCFL